MLRPAQDVQRFLMHSEPGVRLKDGTSCQQGFRISDVEVTPGRPEPRWDVWRRQGGNPVSAHVGCSALPYAGRVRSNPDQQLTHLALSLYNQPGVYAALLGSGMSFSSGIPTAWGVVRALIARLAAAEDVRGLEGDALDGWYAQRYGEAPDYSRVIERLEGTRAGQQALLRPFFEPTPEEAEQRLKQPSAAHRALADLCVRGSVRVILTTNFDRLMERALEERGITPNVASDPGELEVIRPMRHAGVTVIKLHGDYMKANVRNAGDDLAAYDASWDALLDMVLDEYGLIVCGWSGDYDAALRAAILRGRAPRYATYWNAFSPPGPAARQLIAHRHAQVLTGLTADAFFRGVEARVASLERVNATPPLTLDLLEATVKRYLGQPERFRVDLQDLLEGEAQAFSETLHAENNALPQVLPDSNDVEACEAILAAVGALPERFIRMTRALIKYDDDERFAPIWGAALRRIRAYVPDEEQTRDSKGLRAASVALLQHAAITLAAAFGRFRYARELLGWRMRMGPSAAVSALQQYAAGVQADRPFARVARHRFWQPGVDELHGLALRGVSGELLQPALTEDEYEQAADRGEVLLSLAAAVRAEGSVGHPYPGAFMYADARGPSTTAE